MQSPSEMEPQASAQSIVTADEQIVLILSGVVGSGKSTFAEALMYHLPHFIRCNQDELGRRQEVEALARSSLAEGRSICVDRTNVDQEQRAHWIRIAREFPRTQTWLIVFDIPFDVCAERLKARTGHPTIHTSEKAMEVLSRVRNQFRDPQPSEGYDRILYLGPSDQPSNGGYTGDEISVILRRVRDAPRQAQHPRFGRGRGQYGGGSSSSSSHYNGFSRGRYQGRGRRGWGHTQYDTPYSLNPNSDRW